MSAKALTYKDAGVDIDAADSFIQRIKPLVKMTDRPEVLSTVGHYAGLFAIDTAKYKSPVLVSSTDGVGTKVKLALEWSRLEGLGQDLVAMSANDVLCLGAEPLFFLDYFATGKLDVDRATVLLKGIAEACRDIGCTLLGGETAEMPKIYRGDDFDLAGFVVGIVEKDAIIDGATVKPGDKVVGVASSGVHSNGFSLVRKIVASKKLSPDKKYPGLDRPLADALLAPTRLYVKQTLEIAKKFELKGIAHITGGGLSENLPRVFPKNCRAVLKRAAWPMPPLFQWLQKLGHVEDEEMNRVFNCGIGLCVIVPAEQAAGVVDAFKSRNDPAWIIGEIVARGAGDNPIEIL
ncbi:MAG TPA: phosphoribosylformylglycinamidine cyclo-ligase [bacterium]|nr:phosphoribosylformylglycinamidine cyclo-ligase [bacterium]